ncbi:hypothetical protein [Bacillus halotolerans]|uniref:hypothetical protein n=1 Tax=Bacillus halotolerans TaxID=260554 RepID=UPI000A946BE3|nr:hypothetical protein [Bacillus halotolerans]MBL4968776.1 hypothetical protein [Bacillus halotolerans]MBL4972838.1 hypothetical protein [Bacillus halotolerans]QQF61999.1 hypothetical protein I9X38_16320 [Bacillus mojavensis]
MKQTLKLRENGFTIGTVLKKTNKHRCSFTTPKEHEHSMQLVAYKSSMMGEGGKCNL